MSYGEGENRHFRFASLADRTLAFMIDSAVIVIVIYFLQLKFPRLHLLNTVAGNQAVMMLYWILFEGSPLAATPGKIYFDICVADVWAKRAKFWRVALRCLIFMAPALPLGIASLLPGFRFYSETAREIAAAGDTGTFLAFLRSAHTQGFVSVEVFLTVFYFVVTAVFYWAPMFMNRENAGLHDMLSGTRAVKR